MTILVSGEPVRMGDRLFSKRSQAWGTCIQLLDGAIVLAVNKGGDTRNFTATEGGVIAGSRDLYWHAPLDLELPRSQLHKLAKMQAIVDATLSLF